MTTRLSRYLSLDDFELAARKHLPKPLFAYVQGGVEDNQTLLANRSVFNDYFLKPNVLVDVSQRA
jgi:L-lactate dehydrogenase (cytochrome)